MLILERLRIECAKSAQCAPLKHHYDECVERVTEQHEDPDHKGPKENCVEECELCLLLSPDCATVPCWTLSLFLACVYLVRTSKLTDGVSVSSLPPISLRDAVCGSETVPSPQVGGAPLLPSLVHMGEGWNRDWNRGSNTACTEAFKYALFKPWTRSVL